MPENKTDRRSLKTQKALKEALADLLAQKQLRHITVQELSDKADVHRVTFYKHYYDIYELYEELEKQILADFGLLIIKFHENPTHEFANQFIDYIARNPKIFKMIFSPHNTGELRAELTSMVEGIFKLIQTEKNSVELNDSRMDYFCAFWSSGCLAAIEKWVRSDFAQPKEFILKNLFQLDNCLEKYIAEQLK